ncbi:hypothetical protein ACFOY8_14915 [Thalassospira xianhensis]|uniref:Uncharacterized protein n=1 Tax=Thalassospira xianhensis MCCC 1A02616 TaxID=1177929 RepID=A0A367UIU1_9PROT|nr:hypothetical protein [Thalassospira xianhensis]RCK07563.1 hypothetical protein TH5_00310 [Thalassospira xianhensis MCCC 1A02616]
MPVDLSSHPEFSPIEWFGNLSPNTKATFLRATISNFMTQDPTGAQMMEMWRKGKTARTSVRAEMNNDATISLDVHLSVEDADKRLWRTTRGLVERDGELDFRPASAGTVEGTFEGWGVPLGVGSLVIYEKHGAIVLSVNRINNLDIRRDWKVGATMQGDLPDTDGLFILPDEGLITIIACYESPRKHEIASLQTAPFELGLVRVNKHLCVIGGRCGDLTANQWADMPLSLAVEQHKNRKLNNANIDGQLQILCILVDRKTKKVHALRPITLSHDVSQALEDLLVEQIEAGEYTREQYMADVADFQRRYPSPSLVVQAFSVACTSQAHT